MLSSLTSPEWSDETSPIPRSPLPYDCVLMTQARQYKRKDRVHCAACLMGETHGSCRCKFVDKRGLLTGVGASIYFFPDGPATPGNRCRASIRERDLFVTRPCQYRIRELNPSPWNGSYPCSTVWIRCAHQTCTGQACFPYGLGRQGRATEWVNVGRVADLLSPYMDSVRRRIRKLTILRARDQPRFDIPELLMDLYGIGSLLNLRNVCRDLAHESSMRVLLQVYNP